MITLNNFYLKTFATFKGCKMPKREADYISYSTYTGEVSSKYWYGKNSKGFYIIRVSDHWTNYKGFNKDKQEKGCGNIGSCYWKLKTNSNENNKAGKAYLKDFIPF